MLRATFELSPAGSAALGGGVGPGDVRSQVDAAGRGGPLVLLGWRAHAFTDGLEAAVGHAGEAAR